MPGKIVQYGVTIIETDQDLEDKAQATQAEAVAAGKDGPKAYQAVFDAACAKALKDPALRKAHDAARKAHEERVAKDKAAQADKSATTEATT